MDDLLTLIRKAEGFCAIGPASAAEIENAETQLGSGFAPDYRTYVQALGAATFDGHELTGICNSSRLNVVSVTNRVRSYFSEFPCNLYVVEDLYFDHMYIVQDSRGIVYEYGPSEKPKKIAQSLTEYLFKV